MREGKISTHMSTITLVLESIIDQRMFFVRWWCRDSTVFSTPIRSTHIMWESSTWMSYNWNPIYHFCIQFCHTWYSIYFSCHSSKCHFFFILFDRVFRRHSEYRCLIIITHISKMKTHNVCTAYNLISQDIWCDNFRAFGRSSSYEQHNGCLPQSNQFQLVLYLNVKLYRNNEMIFYDIDDHQIIEMKLCVHPSVVYDLLLLPQPQQTIT